MGVDLKQIVHEFSPVRWLPDRKEERIIPVIPAKAGIQGLSASSTRMDCPDRLVVFQSLSVHLPGLETKAWTFDFRRNYETGSSECEGIIAWVLGLDFASEVRSAIEFIIGFPKAWPAIEDDIRRTLIRCFPYGIVYTVEDDAIFILAVMNLHRDPEYWKHRR